MVYKDILKTSRLRRSTVPDRSVVNESESDRGRILFCPAFRRLQQKAQVFSMEPNAAVRSRLTHSLEVAQTGRYIADLISVKLKESNLATEEECRALVNFVETACLMHDIGNPPFGHFGEAAIQKWFLDNGRSVLKKAVGESRVNDDDAILALADFYEFDGNPQGIRVVTQLQWNSDEFGLNLTKTTLASYLKYLRRACANSEDNGKPFQNKAGFFCTEEPIIREVWSEFGISSDTPKRFPLAYIMEAADDIAYCISDLEDSVEKGLLIEKVAYKEIYERWSNANGIAGDSSKIESVEFELEQEILSCLKRLDKGDVEDVFTFTDFRTSLNRALVKWAANNYISHHKAVLSGEFGSLLPKESPAGKVLEVLKEYCREKVYVHESVQRIELAGYKAISGLLELFRGLLECDRERFMSALNGSKADAKNNKIITEKKFLSLFPGRYVKFYKHAIEKIDRENHNQTKRDILEWNARAHLVVDFISGMTDDFAMTTYRTLSGMQI